MEGIGPPHDKLLLYGTAAADVALPASYTFSAGSTVTDVSFVADTALPVADATITAWDELKLTVLSFNLTEMLQEPLPPARLASLVTSVAIATVGSRNNGAALLVSAIHADGGTPRNKPPPQANGLQPPNWWVNRAVNVTFQVPRLRTSAALTCASVQAAWPSSGSPVVNFTRGSCLVVAGVQSALNGGSAGGTGGGNSSANSFEEDWSRSTDDFNATVGVACIVAAVVVVCAVVTALVLARRRQPEVEEATNTQATRQMRRDVQVRPLSDSLSFISLVYYGNIDTFVAEQCMSVVPHSTQSAQW
jgi:hypothetical protein